MNFMTSTQMADQVRNGRHEALTIRHVNHAYGARRALDDVSFDVCPGHFTALLGPNGAGKSTLIGLITRHLALTSGKISIDGRDLQSAGARALAEIGVVFQQSALDLDLTVNQNLTYFASLQGLSRDATDRAIVRTLEDLSMSERRREKVRNLNGGHRRRVEIARALLHEPRLLLLDEPTIGLDVPTRLAIVEHIHRLTAERGLAVLWATHLIDEIWSDDHLIILHQGRIIESGRASEVVERGSADTLAEAFLALTSASATKGNAGS